MDRNGKIIYQGKGSLYEEYNYEHFYFFTESLDYTDKCIYVDFKEKTSKEIDYYYCDNGWDYMKHLIIKEENKKQYLYDISFKPVFKNGYDSIILSDKYCIVKNGNYYNILKYNEDKLVDDNFINYYYVAEDILFLEKEDGTVYYFKYE